MAKPIYEYGSLGTAKGLAVNRLLFEWATPLTSITVPLIYQSALCKALHFLDRRESCPYGSYQWSLFEYIGLIPKLVLLHPVPNQLVGIELGDGIVDVEPVRVVKLEGVRCASLPSEHASTRWRQRAGQWKTASWGPYPKGRLPQ